ncbi:MAG: pilus assembly protein PilM [Planctomycetota bacterium]|jgi:type IV pilus assembly protein PilM
MISWRLKGRNIQPIALDIGHSNIRLLQLCVQDRAFKVSAAESVCVDSEIKDDPEQKKEFLLSTLKEILSKGRFYGREVVSCLPNDKLKITSFRVSETKGEDINEALMREAEQRFGFDPENDTIEHMVAGAIQQGDMIKNELIMFAAEQESINGHIEMLEDAGLKPIAIDVAPCALFRCYARLLRRQEDKEETIVFVDVGSRFTTVVFGRGKEISFIKQIPIGGDRFSREIASKLGISIDEAESLRQKLQVERSHKEKSITVSDRKDSNRTTNLDSSTRQVIVDAIGSVAEELAKEISLCFIYYSVTFRGKRVDRAIFSGGEAYESILLNILKRQLSVEVDIAQPLRGFDMSGNGFDRSNRGLYCDWAVVTGTGLKGVHPSLLGMDNKVSSYERN